VVAFDFENQQPSEQPGPFSSITKSQGSAPLYLLDSAGNPIFVSLDFIKYMTKNVMYL